MTTTSNVNTVVLVNIELNMMYVVFAVNEIVIHRYIFEIVVFCVLQI